MPSRAQPIKVNTFLYMHILSSWWWCCCYQASAPSWRFFFFLSFCSSFLACFFLLSL